jgi:hypothetical protein
MTIIEAIVQLRNDIRLWVSNNLRTKVDKEEGKRLSTNDYTDEEKNKLLNDVLTDISTTAGGGLIVTNKNQIDFDDQIIFVFDCKGAPKK